MKKKTGKKMLLKAVALGGGSILATTLSACSSNTGAVLDAGGPDATAVCPDASCGLTLPDAGGSVDGSSSDAGH